MLRSKVKIGGMRKLLRMLRKLDKKLAKKILRKALRAGAAIIKKAAAKLIPTDTKVLRKAMGICIYIKRKTGMVYAIIGPRTKQKVKTQKGLRWASKYAHLVEGGRKAFRQRARNGRKERIIKAVAPRHFMKRATIQSRGAVKAAILNKAAQEIAKEAGNASS